MNLFKFTSATIAKQILRNCAIRFTPPNEFNDPFEVSPHFASFISNDKLSSLFNGVSAAEQLYHIKKETSVQYALLPEESRAVMSYNQFEELTKLFTQDPNIRQLAEFFIGDVLAQLASAMNKTIQTSSSNTLGMLCLAGHPFSELMWAHYADSHKGVGIVFYENHEFFQQANHKGHKVRKVQNVKYSIERPVFENIFDNLNDSIMETEFVEKLYFTKSKSWEYEEELRCIRPLGEADKVVKLVDGTNIHLFNFPPDCIQGLVFGARCTQADQNEILEILELINPNVKPYPVMKMKVNDRHYTLDCLPM